MDRITNLQPKEPRQSLGCGTTFQPQSSRHVRCGPCGEQHNKARRAAWFKKYRKERNEYFLEYARRRRREQGMQPFEQHERENRRTRRNMILGIFGRRCAICGYDRCARSLHVHHKDPSRKQGDKDYQRKSFIDFDNLIVLCSNCHFEVHDGLLILPTEQ